MIANEYTGTYEVAQLGLSEQIKASAVVVSSEPAEVAFSKATIEPEFVQAYSAVLQQLVADGVMRRLCSTIDHPERC